MTVAVGTQFDHYEILAPLGKGGMGEVYRARDTRLNREVALKVLRESFAQDADRLRRFEQEARATSALNHPNILTVYDFGSHNGAPFIVMELLEGEELRESLKQGALPMRKAIDYAQQIANGLAAAHEKGIVHRDLKPENLFVTKEGRVEILDFGLAKLRPPRNTPVGSDVATQKQFTNPGTVMGTVAYMSPEQVRGQDTDHRSDIFSFGLILFEMLSGKRAFTGESQVEVMNAILKEDPPELSETNAKISPGLEKIVRRCLEKKPEQRFHSAHDLGFALEAVSIPITSSGTNLTEATQALEPAAVVKRSSWRERMAWIVASVAVLTALTLGVVYFKRSDEASADARAAHLSVTPPENVDGNGWARYLSVSPDGRMLAFTGRTAGGKGQLWVRPLDSTETQPLPGTDNSFAPFWSPDSRSIGFYAQGKLKRIDLAGGRIQTLADAPNARGGSWNRAGVILFSPKPSEIWQIPVTGGEPKLVTNHADYPYFLPDGRHFLCRESKGSDGRNRISVGSLDSQEMKELLSTGLTPGLTPSYAPPGWLLYVQDGVLLAQSFDADALSLKGDPLPIAKQVADNIGINAIYSVSTTGVLIWRKSGLSDPQLSWFDRGGNQATVVGQPSRQEALRLSPDGKQVALQRYDSQTKTPNIWVIDLARNVSTPLTSGPTWKQDAVWSPDGKRIVFYARIGDVRGLYQKAASGTGNEQLLLRTPESQPTDWSRDGRFVIYTETGEKTHHDLWVLPQFGDRQPSCFLATEFNEGQGQFSPDGRWLAYVSTESGSQEVYVQPFAETGSLDCRGSGGKWRISPSGGNQPRWRRDGKELYFIAADNTLMAVPINTSGGTFEAGNPNPLFKTRLPFSAPSLGFEYDVTADGQRFLLNTQTGEPGPTQVSVILNWTAGLKK